MKLTGTLLLIVGTTLVVCAIFTALTGSCPLYNLIPVDWFSNAVKDGVFYKVVAASAQPDILLYEALIGLVFFLVGWFFRRKSIQ